MIRSPDGTPGTGRRRLRARRRWLPFPVLALILFTGGPAFLPGSVPTQEQAPHPELFMPGRVSTGREHSAALFPSDDEIIFARLEPAAIFSLNRTGEEWSEARPAAFSGEYPDLYPTLSYDGRRLFFTSQRPLTAGGPALPRGQGVLWYVERGAQGWSGPVRVGLDLPPGVLASGITTTGDGTLYFCCRNPVDPDRSMDIYRTRQVEGRYQEPVNVTELNSDAPDLSPCVAPDGAYIVFSSFRGGYGRSDLFVSFPAPDGRWSAPRNLGPAVNSAQKDEYPWVSSDGRWLFFNSNRPSELNARPIPDGPGNIYRIEATVLERIRILPPE